MNGSSDQNEIKAGLTKCVAADNIHNAIQSKRIGECNVVLPKRKNRCIARGLLAQPAAKDDSECDIRVCETWINSL